MTRMMAIKPFRCLFAAARWRHPYRAVAVAAIMFLLSQLPANAALPWGSGPYWEATWAGATCSRPSPAGYVDYGSETCLTTFPGLVTNLTGLGKFFFSDDAPGLMVFESQFMREVKEVYFKSADSGFKFSRPGGIDLTTTYYPKDQAYLEVVHVGFSGTLDYEFVVTGRSFQSISGTFTVKRPFIAFEEFMGQSFVEDRPPYIGTVTVTGTWSAVQTIAAPPSPWMNGHDVCNYQNSGLNYNDLSAACNGNPKQEYWFCDAGTANTCVYNVPAAQGVIELRNPLGAVLHSKDRSVDVQRIKGSPPAKALSADGVSATVVSVVMQGNEPITLEASPHGTLTPFGSDYIVSPPAYKGQASLEVANPTCDATGLCTYLALLWPPNWPTPLGTNPKSATITVAGYKAGEPLRSTSVRLILPPVLLVHGVWSDSGQAGFAKGAGGLRDWLAQQYEPGHLIDAVDYGVNSHKAFFDPLVQSTFLDTAGKFLDRAAALGIVARQFDVVAHSMGGLVTRKFVNSNKTDALPANVVHRLISIGTPHTGTKVAVELNLHIDDQLPIGGPVPASPTLQLLYVLCSVYPSQCSLGGILEAAGKKLDTGVDSLQYGLSVAPQPTYKAIVGTSPAASITEGLLSTLVALFVPGKSTVTAVLDGEPNDTLVPASSQSAGAAQTAVIADIVHTGIMDPFSTGETASQAVWNQTFSWLTGQAPLALASAAGTAKSASAAPSFIDLTGYTRIDAASSTVSPPAMTALSIGKPVTISVSSIAKTITQVWLFQTLVAPADTAVLAVTEAPFALAFTPRHLGSVQMAAFVLFDDLTFAVAPLEYVSQLNGAPGMFTLSPPGNSNLLKGTTTPIRAIAKYPNIDVDVSGLAQYVVRSGTPNVITVGSGGNVFAVDDGTDFIDVAFMGWKASARVAVASLPTYSLTVTKRGSGGGTVTSDDLLLVCGVLCTQDYPSGPGPLLTAIPAAGSVFTGWLGHCSGTSACSTTLAGHASVSATFAPESVGNHWMDIDKNSGYDALTDGLMAVRYLFGANGIAIASGVIGVNPLRTDPTQIAGYLSDIRPKLDIDGNGQADPFTDGLMLIRYLFGLRDTALITNAIGLGATRATAPEIESYIQSIMP